MVVALDFETANADPGSICAVGLTFLGEDGQLCSRGTLVRPPRACNWFSSFNIAVHHITGDGARGPRMGRSLAEARAPAGGGDDPCP